MRATRCLFTFYPYRNAHPHRWDCVRIFRTVKIYPAAGGGSCERERMGPGSPGVGSQRERESAIFHSFPRHFSGDTCSRAARLRKMKNRWLCPTGSVPTCQKPQVVDGEAQLNTSPSTHQHTHTHTHTDERADRVGA